MELLAFWIQYWILRFFAFFSSTNDSTFRKNVSISQRYFFAGIFIRHFGPFDTTENVFSHLASLAVFYSDSTLVFSRTSVSLCVLHNVVTTLMDVHRFQNNRFDALTHLSFLSNARGIRTSVLKISVLSRCFFETHDQSLSICRFPWTLHLPLRPKHVLWQCTNILDSKLVIITILDEF